MEKAVVLLSGGLDSATTLALAKSAGLDIFALSFDYGQRHSVELDSAVKVAEAFGTKKHLVITMDLSGIGGSALTDDIDVPKGRTPPQIRNESRRGGRQTAQNDIPVTYVPARNTIFLSFALAWAEILGAGKIYIGANAVDYSGYPDCRPEFMDAFEKMANLATKVSVEGQGKFAIITPLMNMNKAEIIKTGTELGVDYSLTWSCYDPVVVPGSDNKALRPCMSCDSCVLRAKGFSEAGIADPLLVQGNKK